MLAPRPSLIRCLALAASLLGLCFAAPTEPTAAKEKLGDWLTLSPDGRPYKHEGTDLSWPQHLGDFVLRVGFRDKRTSAGISLSYLNEKKDIRSDILIYPTPTRVPPDDTVVTVMQAELEKLMADLQPNAVANGYRTTDEGSLEVRSIPLWQLGEIPMLIQQMTLGPADPAKANEHPPLKHWLGLILYQDHYVHLSIIMRETQFQADAAIRNTFINAFLQCIREPAIIPEMLKLCHLYLSAPLTDKSRSTADSLLAFTKDSPNYEVSFPGEAFTPALDAMKAKANGLELDLLRAYIVGACVVNLQGGSNDEMIEEGSRVMTLVYEQLKEKKSAPSIPFLEELTAAAAKERAAAFLKPRSGGGIVK